MDETPEELDQIRREADQIDVHQYKKRFRAMAAVGLGSLAAGAVWLVLVMVDSRRNPCERVRNHFCKQDPAGMQCQTTSPCTTTAPPCAPTSSPNASRRSTA